MSKENELDMRFKQSEDYRKYSEMQETKFKGQVEALSIQAENKVTEMLRATGYGNVKTQKVTSDISDELSGSVLVILRGYKDDKDYTVKFPVSIAEGKVQDLKIKDALRAETPEEIKEKELQGDMNEPVEEELVFADLSKFKLVDDGTEHYKLYHPHVNPSEPVASISKKEYDDAVNKKPLLVSAVRQEAGVLGIDLRFAGQFVLPKVSKMGEEEPADDRGWKKGARDSNGNEIVSGCTVEGEFGEGLVENILKDEDGLKVFINVNNKKIMLPVCDISVKTSIQKEARVDDRDKFLIRDAVKQYTEGQDLKQSKQIEALTVQTENESILHLRGLGFEGIELRGGSSAELESKRTGYHGKVTVNLEASFDNETKEFTLPVVIRNDMRIFPKKPIIMEAFKEGCVDCSVEEEINREIAEKIEQVNIQQEWENKETEQVLTSLDKEEPIKKEASGATSPPKVHYAPVLHISRNVLPEDTNIGDVLWIQGAKYKVTSLSENSISREADSGSLVTLELVHSKPTDEEGDMTGYTS